MTIALPDIGASASLSKTVTDADVVAFAEVSLDTNPVHLDDAVAARTRFKGRIAHGMLAASLVSAVLGTRLPGPGTIYLGQTLAFKGPVRIGDTITATATVKARKGDKPILVLDTTVTNQHGEVVLSGEATVLVEPVA
ncbi:MAG: MaoC family dehydratase [Myxococcota bacterium]